MKKKKIVVLGGGAGSLSAVYYLTRDSDWKDKYEITVYQTGWRLGGKCASGRNRSEKNNKDHGLRIEEHGVHLLFGAYENTFRLINDCYTELGRDTNEPLSSVFEPINHGDKSSTTKEPFPKYAFTARSTFSLYDRYSENHNWWNRKIEGTPRYPGNSNRKREPDFLSVLAKFTKTLFNDLLALRKSFAKSIKAIWDIELDENFLEIILQSLEKDSDSQIDFQRLFRLLLPDSDFYIQETETEKPAGFLESALSHSNVSVEQLRNSSLLDALDTVINHSTHKSLASSQFVELMVELYSEQVKRLQSLDAFKTQLQNIQFEDSEKQKKLQEFIENLNRVAYTNQLCGAIAIGLFRHRVFETGLDPLDPIEFTDWLKQNGIAGNHNHIWMSPIVQGIYETVFGYRFSADHDNTIIKRPGLSTAVALRGTIRFFADCDGGFVWEMNSGMGDTVFAPLYMVLYKRGVNFRFFHKIDQLVLERKNENTFVKEIKISKQLHSLRHNRSLSEYDPLIHVDLLQKEEVDCPNSNSLECWPNQPKYELLCDEHAQSLKKIYRDSNGTIDLESDVFDWGLDPDGETPINEQFTLNYASDRDDGFDELIIGAGLGAIPKLLTPTDGSDTIWPDTPESDGYTWKELTEELSTLKTQSVQLWMNCKPVAKGSKNPRITAFLDNWPNWVGMTQVEKTECREESEKAEHIAYLFRQLEEVTGGNTITVENPVKAKTDLQEQLVEFLKKEAHVLWTEDSSIITNGQFNWDVLLDQSTSSGPEQCKISQYFRVNLNSTDRYVPAPPNSLRLRPKPDNCGLANGYLATDWARNGFNCGSVESAVMSGMQVARKICGKPEHVYWEKRDFEISLPDIDIVAGPGQPAGCPDDVPDPHEIKKVFVQAYEDYLLFNGGPPPGLWRFLETVDLTPEQINHSTERLSSTNRKEVLQEKEQIFYKHFASLKVLDSKIWENQFEIGFTKAAEDLADLARTKPELTVNRKIKIVFFRLLKNANRTLYESREDCTSLPKLISSFTIERKVFISKITPYLEAAIENGEIPRRAVPQIIQKILLGGQTLKELVKSLGAPGSLDFLSDGLEEKTAVSVYAEALWLAFLFVFCYRSFEEDTCLEVTYELAGEVVDLYFQIVGKNPADSARILSDMMIKRVQNPVKLTWQTDLSATYMTFKADKSRVANFLPEGLEAGTQPIFDDPDYHPVLIIAGQQRNVRPNYHQTEEDSVTRSNYGDFGPSELESALLNMDIEDENGNTTFPCYNYLETFVLIPFVTHNNKLYCYSTVIYVDKNLPEDAGLLAGLPKKKAVIDISPSSYDIYSNNVSLLRISDIQHAGTPTSPDNATGFDRFTGVFSLPHIVKLPGIDQFLTAKTETDLTSQGSLFGGVQPRVTPVACKAKIDRLCCPVLFDNDGSDSQTISIGALSKANPHGAFNLSATMIFRPVHRA